MFRIMSKIVVILALVMEIQANFTIIGLKGNVFVKEENKVHLFHEEWRLMIGINMTTTEQRVSAVDYTLPLAETACGK